MLNGLAPAWLYLVLACNGAFALVTLAEYPGHGYIYLLFSVLLNFYLYLGLRRGSMFFETFLGIFFWIGFWLKFSVRMTFADGKFHHAVGYFDYSAGAYDRALLVVSCGISGLLIARLLRERFIFPSPMELKTTSLCGAREFYEAYRNWIWLAFVIVVLAVTLTNAYWGIYQRGTVPRTIFPYGLGGVYTWFLLFGASSISAVLLHFEVQTGSGVPKRLMVVVLFEAFFSSVSMLSRGMILNSGALLLGLHSEMKRHKVLVRFRAMVATLVMLVVLFIGSIYLVSELRAQIYLQHPDHVYFLDVEGIGFDIEGLGKVGSKLVTLVMDRWIGMEGALAVSSYPELGWDLWSEVWSEKYSERGTSMYDQKIAKSVYSRHDMSRHHFVSMPGVLAFFFYPGSYGFLFLAMVGLGILGATVEIGVFKWGGGNLILCSLIGFIVAYRYVHFGYAPERTYLLAGAIVLNIALIYLIGRALANRGGTVLRVPPGE